MSTLLNFQNDIKGYNSYAPAFSADKFSATLAAAGNATITVPAHANYTHWVVAFSYSAGSNIWVSVDGTAAGPAGATFASTTSQLLPGALAVNTGDTINVLNNGTGSADVGAVFYAIS